ncbi:MAG: Ig domain-containing protein [Myxococcota bacterium]
MKRARLGALVFCVVTACSFAPDLTRYPPCGAAGGCPPGWSCLKEANRCVPPCGESPGCELDAGHTDGGEALILSLTFDGGALPRATETLPYSQALRPSGGRPPYGFFGPQRSNLPPEFSLSTTGVLSAAMVAQVGTFSFEVGVSDDAGSYVTAPFSLRVDPLLRLATRSPLAIGVANQAYTERFGATGGEPPFIFSLDGGALPGGVMLAADGTLSGAPSPAGTYTFAVAVEDSASPPQRTSRAYSVEVKLLSAIGAVEMATQALADGRVGWPYSQSLRGNGGSAPYTWEVVGGLPPGLVLSDNSTVGELSGMPTDAGTYNVTLKLTDSFLGNQQKTFSLQVF